jgi:VanZ family protein
MGNEIPKPLTAIWWTVTVAWAVLIFYLSTQGFGSDFTQGMLAWGLELLHLHVSPRSFHLLHAFIRKLAHLVEYAIFALLLYGPPVEGTQHLWRPRRAVFCIVGAALYSLTDEFHQLWVPGRTGSLLDCGLDTLGASLAMLVPYTGEQVLLFRSRYAASKN